MFFTNAVAVTLLFASQAVASPVLNSRDIPKPGGPPSFPSQIAGPGTVHPSSQTFDNTTLYLKAIDVQTSTGFAEPACWAMQPNITVGTAASLLGTYDTSLGDVQSASYVYFPDDFNAPLHGPAANQYVIFLTGFATIFFPNVTGTIPCQAGTNLVVVDNSTMSAGHFTNWTAGTSAILVQFKDGIEPPHMNVNTSLCGF